MSAPSAPIVGGWPTCLQTSIRFWWQAPATGAPLTKYTLACSAISFSQDLSANLATYTVTGLTAGTEYQFTLTATNTTGTGPALAFPRVGVGLVPFGPTAATVSTVNTSTALVSWTPSTIANQAPIRGYFVTAIPSTAGASTLFKTEYGYRTSTFIKGISTNTYYRFLVQGVAAPGYCIPFAYTSNLGFGITTFPFSPSSLSYEMRLWIDATNSNSYTTATSGGNVFLGSLRDTRMNSVSTTSLGTWQLSTSVTASKPIFQAFAPSPQSFYANFTSSLYTGDSITGFFIGSFKYDAATAHRIITLTGPGGQDYEDPRTGILVSGGNNQMFGVFRAYPNSKSASYPYPAFNTLALVSANLSPTYQYVGVNGSYVSTSAGTLSSFNMSNIGIGQNNVNSYFNGAVGEVLLYYGALTPFDRQKVEGYLGWKWNLQGSMPTYHPFKTAAPTSASVFSPSSFGGLQLWLDAADTTTVTLTGGRVSSWADKSGNGYNATSTIRGSNIVFSTSINSLSTLYFNSTSIYGTFSPAYTGSNTHSFFVGNFDTGAAGYNRVLAMGVLGAADHNNILYTSAFTRASNTSQIVAERNGSVVTSVTNTSPFLASAYNTPGSRGINANGGSITSNASSSGPFNLSNYVIGGPTDTGAAGEYFIGRVGEVLVYNTALSTDDRQTVEGYLAWKWGLQANLPSTHPYKNKNPGSI
jgi:hypothetical protein